MQKISAYFRSVSDSSCEVRSFCVPDWYAKPAILSSLAHYLHDKSNGLCVFICCTKYGCRQFLPEKSKSFPISFVYFVDSNSETQNAVILFGK